MANSPERRLWLDPSQQRFLRRLERSLSAWAGPDERTALLFAKRTGYASETLLKWLSRNVPDKEDCSELNRWLKESAMEPLPALPEERNPELEARCQKLRAELEAKEYARITANVSSSRDSSSFTLAARDYRSTTRHITSIVNMCITVACAFLVGYAGLNVFLPAHAQLNMTSRIMVGIIFASIVFCADLYFLARQLDADLTATDEKKAK